jgi:hypothetical protein
MEYNHIHVYMEIILEEPLNRFATKIYNGTRYRYPSVTDVVFVTPDRIVATHRYACKLYYIQLEGANYRILDELTLYVNGQMYQTEMMDIRDTTIYLISFSERLTIIDIVHDKLQVRQGMSLNSTNTQYHGIQVHKNLLYLTPSNKAVGDDSIIVWNTDTHAIVQRIDIGSNVRIKDITFLSDERIVLLGNYKTTTNMTMHGHTFNGFIALYTRDFKQLDVVTYTTTHFDSVTSKDGIFYATGDDANDGYIYVGSADNDKLTPIKQHKVQDFPHGIAIHGNKLAYTSYATSGVYITDVVNFA